MVAYSTDSPLSRVKKGFHTAFHISFTLPNGCVSFTLSDWQMRLCHTWNTKKAVPGTHSFERVCLWKRHSPGVPPCRLPECAALARSALAVGRRGVPPCPPHVRLKPLTVEL